MFKTRTLFGMKGATLKRGAWKSLRIMFVAALLLAFCAQLLGPTQNAKADVAAGYSEYYVPGAADDLWDILNDLSTFDGNNFTNVITMPITTPDLTVYYDHWENGYSTGAAGDETYTGYTVGQVLTFKSPSVPSNPRGTSLTACTGSTNPAGTTNRCYDGMDRIFVVGGAVSISHVYWPVDTGTVYANAWEIYPVKPWETSYTIPVGENLYAANPTAYADYDCVYVLVEAWYADTTITFDNKRTSAPGLNVCGNSWWSDSPAGGVTIQKGKTYFRGGVYSGSTIVANHPVEVQLIVGREDSTYDSRSHTIVPSSEWDKEYYSPVPSYTDGTNVNIYMYNPGSSTLAVTYDDSGAGTSTCNIPAGGTLSIRDCISRFVAAGSAVHLTAASKFFAIGEYDSGQSTRNWGFSIIPKSALQQEYFVPWAPGNTNVPPSGINGSPVYVTPTVNGQVFYVDYSPITTPPTTELTFTLNQLQVRKILDPDIDNTGMHVWSDYPFAITWGEDAQYADTGNPYIDAGYTIPPPNSRWIDVILEVTKQANPEVIAKLVGEEVEFTVNVNTYFLALDNIFIEDYLPPYFQYVAGTTNITWPGHTYTTDPVITGAAATGYTLHWGTAPDNIGDMGTNQTMTLKFKAVTVTGFSADSSLNNTKGTGYLGLIPISATAQAVVTAGQPGYITVIKDAIPDGPQDFAFTLINQARPNSPTNFSLDDDTDPTLPKSRTFGLRAGNYSVAETAVTGWDLTSVVCNSSLGGTEVPTNIVLAAGETVTCTFTNTQRLADVRVTKSDGDNWVKRGETFTYSITVDYPQSDDPRVPATNVVMTDTLDPTVRYVGPWNFIGDVTPSCTPPVSTNGGIFSCTVASMTEGQSYTVSFPVQVLQTATINGLIEVGTCSTTPSNNQNGNQVDICNLVSVTTATTESDYSNNNDSEPKDVGKSTAVTLIDFAAVGASKSVTLSWETTSETDNMGFNLYRANSENGKRVLVNEELIESTEAGNPWGAEYEYIDEGLNKNKTYYYWLEDIDAFGVATLHGPVSAQTTK